MPMAVAVRADLWILARELARALEESPEIQRFRETEDALLADEEALAIVREYEARKRAVKFSRNLPQAEQMQRIEAFMAVEAQWNANPRIQAYWQAREELDALMDRLNAVITYPITGAEAPRPKGGCGSGGGCGCGS